MNIFYIRETYFSSVFVFVTLKVKNFAIFFFEIQRKISKVQDNLFLNNAFNKKSITRMKKKLIKFYVCFYWAFMIDLVNETINKNTSLY